MSVIAIKQKIRKILPRPILELLAYVLSVRSRLPGYELYVRHVAGGKGIEIGGPSALFKTILPLYRKVGDLDGVNFSTDTIWEGELRPGRSFSYIGNRKGTQFIADATDLSQIEDDVYDFLLSSNCLEHVANPLKALMEWKRVMRPGGALILVLPNKAGNFDHRRPTTTFEHILADFNNGTTEQDLTHLDEILALHDLSMDPPAGDLENFKKRSLDNFKNRTLHHHVFDLNVMERVLEFAGFEVIETTGTRTDFFALAKKGFRSA